MEAGSDTTTSTLLTFVLAMTQHPEILKKAQEEVDHFCGSDRSPNFDDIGKLEYLMACMNEVSSHPITQFTQTYKTLTYADTAMATNRTWRYSSHADSR